MLRDFSHWFYKIPKYNSSQFLVLVERIRAQKKLRNLFSTPSFFNEFEKRNRGKIATFSKFEFTILPANDWNWTKYVGQDANGIVRKINNGFIEKNVSSNHWLVNLKKRKQFRGGVHFGPGVDLFGLSYTWNDIDFATK